MKNYKIIEPHELDTVIALWKVRLRLQDWDVDSKIVSTETMKTLDGQTGNRRGEIEYEPRLNHCVMRILDFRDPYWANPDRDCDMEKTVVHELLHLKFIAFDDAVEKNPLAEWALELGIDTIARSLVELARGEKAAELTLQAV